MSRVAIKLHLLPEQKILIDHAAEVQGKRRSEFILEAACDQAQSVLLDERYFTVNATAFREFQELLDRPVAPNPGLARLLAVVPPWE